MIASDMLPLPSSLMLATPRSSTKTVLHSCHLHDRCLIMANALYYSLSRPATETSLPRFPPLPLYRSNTYFPPFSERAFRVTTPPPTRVCYEQRAKNIANV